MTYRPQPTKTVAQLTPITTVASSLQSPISDSLGNLNSVSEAQRLAWILANDGSMDLAAATVLTSIPNDYKVVGISNGAPAVVSWATLLASAGSTATAPSQVGGLAAGTPTSTTIPVMYTAATGTATITYAGQTALHGSSTWTTNGGTFTSTGGTFTGLTPSTDYDLRVLATNTAGTSTTTLTNVTDATGTGGPSMTFSVAPAYTTTAQKFGSGALISNGTAGKGTATTTGNLPVNPSITSGPTNQAEVLIRFWYKSGGGSFTPGSGFLYLYPSGGTAGTSYAKTTQGANSYLYIAGGHLNGACEGSTNMSTSLTITDGAWHFVEWRLTGDVSTTYQSLYVDGTLIGSLNDSGYLDSSTTYTLFVDMTELASGDLIDDIHLLGGHTPLSTPPTAAQTRTSSTLILLPLDGTGVGL